MSAENNTDIKLCQNRAIENMWHILCRQKICLKIYRQICQTYYAITTLTFDFPSTMGFNYFNELKKTTTRVYIIFIKFC